jgi:integrase/recombinase XerD
MLQKSTKRLGLGHAYSAHAMRATFTSTVLENGAKLEDVQRMEGHADRLTTKLYDRRRFMVMK